MVQKFRKKPVVVEAYRYMGPFSYDEMTVEWGESFANIAKLINGFLTIQTLESHSAPLQADIGDWIIRGVAGEYYPCKPYIFDETYALVESAETTFRQSHSLVPSGVESADIGKLDAVDKSGVEMGKVNRVEENDKLKELLRRGYTLFNVEGTDFAEPEEVGEKWMLEVEEALFLSLPDDSQVAGSAETGGEKAAKEIRILDRNGKLHQSVQTCPGCSADYYDVNFHVCPSCGRAMVYDLETA